MYKNQLASEITALRDAAAYAAASVERSTGPLVVLTEFLERVRTMTAELRAVGDATIDDVGRRLYATKVEAAPEID